MAAKNRTHVSGSGQNVATPQTPKSLTKQEFGRRLYQLMLSKGLRQSDLARESDIQRNAISTYILGKSLPNDINLNKLAKVFKMKSDELLPNHALSAIENDIPLMSFQVSPGSPDKAWLRINQLVKTATAMQVIALLQSDNDNRPVK